LAQAYKGDELSQISKPNCLYAVNIKGVTSEDYRKNTGCEIDWYMFWHNLEMLILRHVPFYFTFTHPDKNHYDEFCNDLVKYYGKSILKDSFIIDLIKYKALEACK
jgi:hypothetical protein